VEEGTEVKRGQVLAIMSSADRAVLLDNARSKGPEEVKYWEEAYKATPIIAPANGLIISRNVVEGQTVSPDTDLYDLSDRLIVQAAVDETDLGKIRGNQRAEVTVDAYPDKIFIAHVRLISHQSTKVNNVVTYYVQLDPDDVPGTLRAGMTANVNFIVQEKKNVLMLPAWAVKGAEKTKISAKVFDKANKKPAPRDIMLGASDGTQVEVLSGLKEGDMVMVEGLKLGAAASAGIFGMGGRGGAGARPAGGGSGAGGGGSRGGAGR
jgi:membrane fusion protein, macrolide-specific efflux system